MKALLKQTAATLLAIIVIYGLILIVAFVASPPEKQSKIMDTTEAAQTIFMTEPKYVFLNRAPLRSAEEKVVLLGASNVVVGFKPKQVQPLISNAHIHNLAIGGSNITQLAQVFRLAQEVQNDTAQKHTIYVIGIWYGNFFTDESHWNTADRVAGDTDIDIERYRYGFWHRSATGPVRVVRPDYLDAGIALIRPYLLFDQLIRNLTLQFREKVHHPEQQMRTDEQRDNSVVPEADKVKSLEYWRTTIGQPNTLPDEQFDVLNRLIENILSSGEKVVLVELPIPSWHAQRSPYFKDYQRHMEEVSRKFHAQPGFYLLNMQDMNADNDFSDEVHPKPRVTIQWAQKLAGALNPILKSLPPNEQEK